MQIECVLEKKGPEVYCIHPDEQIYNCMKIINSRHIKALVVLTPDEKIVGIITERDVFRATLEHKGKFDGVTVRDYMTPKQYLTTAKSTDDITEVMAVMTRKKVRHVPIVDDGKLIGVLSILDVMKALYDNAHDQIMEIKTNRKKVSINDLDKFVGDIAEVMRAKGWKLATAESCTGGIIAGRITANAGVSDFYEGSIVSYSNDVKNSTLNVDEKLLKQFGAVSAEVAEAMALGACQKLGTEVAVSVTGVAGPTGGTEEKPVGLVYVATVVNGKVSVSENNFTGDRIDIRMQTMEKALQQLFLNLI